MGNFIYYSSDFQCPDTGVPVYLLYDEKLGVITTEICDSVWDTWKNEKLYDAELYAEEERETNEWCKHFRKYAETFDEANEIAEKYDCWF